jgi:NAD+ synthase (glutamine-hydrolysing)
MQTFDAYLNTLRCEFARTKQDVTEENLQARIRGNILMALSNKFGWLVLTTGNKSEMSVGYATLYGDMAGGFASRTCPRPWYMTSAAASTSSREKPSSLSGS